MTVTICYHPVPDHPSTRPVPMPADNEPQPLTTPALNHARMEWNPQHPNGFIHLDKKDSNGRDLMTTGYVRGDSIAIGYAVSIQKNNKNKTWEGTITNGPNVNENGLTYWSFTVQNKVNLPDPDQDDTVTVTVTDRSGQKSNSVASDPQPDEVP